MHTFIADLLIGGMVLPHKEGELESEWHPDDDHDWMLAGRIEFSAHEIEFLELGRQYRLELEDGRASQVVLARIEPIDAEHFVGEFVPRDDSAVPSTTTAKFVPR